ncbi:hypothetical protein B0H16DRAFT_1450839 [Mycena metata]|uniref:Uncharacterized protein n=1 Tax=Mycena metata TaxID=1033252 RepID=A0AAD7NSQ6_9AGAR|nr:hypothetical protein B0H16DRAFT_1450839 [Mycena metata]
MIQNERWVNQDDLKIAVTSKVDSSVATPHQDIYYGFAGKLQLLDDGLLTIHLSIELDKFFRQNVQSFLKRNGGTAVSAGVSTTLLGPNSVGRTRSEVKLKYYDTPVCRWLAVTARPSTGRFWTRKISDGTGTAPVERLPLNRRNGNGRQP